MIVYSNTLQPGLLAIPVKNTRGLLVAKPEVRAIYMSLIQPSGYGCWLGQQIRAHERHRKTAAKAGLGPPYSFSCLGT